MNLSVMIYFICEMEGFDLYLSSKYDSFAVLDDYDFLDDILVHYWL